MNITQGTLWRETKNRLNLDTDPSILPLPLLMSYDDWLPFNPLGSKNRLFKLSSKYSKIAVLPKSLESKFKETFSLATFFPAHLKEEFTINQLFGFLFDELKRLRSIGIVISNKDYQHLCKAVKLVPLVLGGDNLGTHECKIKYFHLYFFHFPSEVTRSLKAGMF